MQNILITLFKIHLLLSSYSPTINLQVKLLFIENMNVEVLPKDVE